MLEVLDREDGKFTVCDEGSGLLDPVLAVFGSRIEAEEWMLDRAMKRDEAATGLNVLTPGGGQGL